MKNKLLFTRSLALLAFIILMMMPGKGWGQTTQTWSGTTSISWLTATNWSSAVPGNKTTTTNNDIAYFNNTVNVGVTINMNTQGGAQYLGALNFGTSATTARSVANSSATGGTMYFNSVTLNGVNNTILWNQSSATHTFTNGAGTLNMGLNATDHVIQITGTGGVTIASVITGTSKNLEKAGAGSGVLTLTGVNTYTGTTILTAGELRLNPTANLSMSGACTFNGGKLATTGIAGTRTITFASINISDNSTLALLASTNHTITFTSKGTFASGKALTITGWTGSYVLGTTGAVTAAPKVFIGNSASLTPAELAQIKFNNGTNNYAATQLSTGEIVPTTQLVVSAIGNQTAGVGFSVTVTAKDLDGIARALTNATGIALTSTTGGTIGGTTTGSIAAASSAVTISGVTLTAGTAQTITATRSSGDNPVAGISAAFDVVSSGAPSLAITGTPTNHGSVCPNTAASSVQYTITNAGAVQADGIQVNTDNAEFAVSGLSATSIAASGGSVTYNVTFTPTGSGSKSANITVTSTTSGSNSPISALTGTGLTPASPVVSSSAATPVVNTTARLNGNVTTLGVCPTTTAKGFVYSKTIDNADPIAGQSGVTTSSVSGLATGAYYLDLAALSPGTEYKFKAYLYDGATYTYSGLTTFTTLTTATKLAYGTAPPSTGTVGSNLTSFTVQAQRADNSVDVEYAGNIIVAKVSGSGNISGTLTVAPSAGTGIATFSAVQFDAVDTYTIKATSAGLTDAPTSGNIVVSLTNSTINAWINSSTATAWCTAGNWNISAPTSSHVAQWNNAGSAVGCGITFSNCVPSILGIEVTSSRTRTLTIGSSSSTSGTLTLNGGVVNSIPNVILHNASNSDFTLQPILSSSGTMGIALGNTTSNKIIIEGNGNIDITAVISSSSGSTPLIKEGSGAGILYLGGTNTYSGGTIINSGTLSVNGSGRLGQASGNLNINNGTFQLTTASVSGATRNIVLGHSNSTIDIATGVAYTSTTGVVSGGGNLNKTGAGTLELQAANSYTGTTVVSGGLLKLNKTGGTTIPITNDATINGGTLQVSSDQALNNLALASGTLTVDNGVTLTINGTFTYTSGTITLTGTGKIAYGTNGILKYDGTGFTTTTDAEFPSTNGPKDLNINNAAPAGLTLHANRTLAGTLTIASGKSLILPVNRQLTVNGATTLNGAECLVLKSDVTGTASFIDNGTISGTGTAKVERFLTQYAASGGGNMYHFISSPVADQVIRPGFVTTPATAGEDFYSYSESGNLWINTRADEAGSWNTGFESTFTLGKGYMVAYPADVTKNFIGTLNSYTVGSPLVLTCTNTPAKGEGWNLLGNPFASAIDWSAVSRGNGMDDALYYYDNTAQNYNYYIQLAGDPSLSLGTGQQYIPAMQGFMVHAKSTGTKTVTISNAARTHSGQGVFYKSTNSVPGSLSLKVSANGYEDEAFIHFNQNATTAFDGKYDAFKLKSYSTNVPSIYTVASDGNQLAINGLPEVEENSQIPVYFVAGKDGQYTLTANLQNLPEAHVYLVDNKLSKTQNLSDNPVYTFAASTTDQPNRFKLTFNSVGINEPAGAEPLHVYMNGTNLNVTGVANANAEIHVTNMIGQVVLRGNTGGNTQTVLNTNKLQNGVYVVSLISGSKVVSTKIVVSR